MAFLECRQTVWPWRAPFAQILPLNHAASEEFEDVTAIPDLSSIRHSAAASGLKFQDVQGQV